MKPAILFLVFNRPDTTEQVFETIKLTQPKKLYIAADGPRSHILGEKELCEKVKKIVSQVNWDCEVKTLLRENNLGCGRAVSEAITWFFENEEEGIILEDDVLPNESFFKFCATLLREYRYNEDIISIGGYNPCPQLTKAYSSDFLFGINHCWGWASWRRAWKNYKFDIADELGELSNKDELLCLLSNYQKMKLCIAFNSLAHNNLDTWDYQWTYCQLRHKQLAIIPKVSLVENIGLQHYQATHKIYDKNIIKASNINLPLVYPTSIHFQNLECLSPFEKIKTWLKYKNMSYAL